jgi:hypothetical protein
MARIVDIVVLLRLVSGSCGFVEIERAALPISPRDEKHLEMRYLEVLSMVYFPLLLSHL